MSSFLHLRAIVVATAVAATGSVAACTGDDLGAVPPTGDVEGYLCDPITGGLAAGATVEGPGANGALVSAEADSTGFFELDDVAAGEQTLTISAADGSFTASIEVTVTQDQTLRLDDPPCLVAPSGTLTGRICADETRVGSGEGFWLAGADVRINVDGVDYETTTDADGFFTLPGVPAGTHDLSVSKGSFNASESVVIRPDETTTLDYVCLEPTTRMAVLTGRFDSIEAILEDLGFGLRECERSGVDADLVASCPATPDSAGSITLFDGEAADGAFVPFFLMDSVLLSEFDIIFFDCGLRDELFRPGQSPDEARANLRAFVQGGGSIYVSDFAYDVVRSWFPAAGLNFVGDDTDFTTAPPPAKVGMENTVVNATVLDATLAARVGGTVDIVFDDPPDWVALNPTQAPQVKVWVSGDVQIDPQGDGTSETLADSPLLVSVPFGEGTIVFTSFHNHAQTNTAMGEILRYIVFEL